MGAYFLTNLLHSIIRKNIDGKLHGYLDSTIVLAKKIVGGYPPISLPENLSVSVKLPWMKPWHIIKAEVIKLLTGFILTSYILL